MGGGGFHGGGGGYHGGGVSSGYHGSYGSGTYAYHGGYTGSYGYHGGYGGYRGGYPWRGGYPGRYPYRPYGYGYWGRGYYPWWGIGWGGGYYPGWGWGWYGDGWYDSYDSSAYTPTAPSYPSYVYVTPDGSVDYSQSQTQDEINDLKGQVAQLQQQQSQPASPKMTEIHSDTILVYRDGHTETVQNYAISGKTLWVFSETRARRIPLSDLDISATKRDNEDRGGEFIVPGSTR